MVISAGGVVGGRGVVTGGGVVIGGRVVNGGRVAIGGKEKVGMANVGKGRPVVSCRRCRSLGRASAAAQSKPAVHTRTNLNFEMVVGAIATLPTARVGRKKGRVEWEKGKNRRQEKVRSRLKLFER